MTQGGTVKLRTVGALLGSAVLLSLASACDGGRASPAAPVVTSAPTASRTKSLPVHSDLSAEADAVEDRGCSDASLEGGYGFVRTGTSAGPLVAVGLVTYDGAGNWIASGTISRSGAYTFDAVSTGTYVVGADCTGTVLSNGQAVGLLDVVDGGKEVLVLSTAAGDAVSERQKKVGLRGCSNASLEGTFGFIRTGTTSVGPLAAVGLGIYDGSGNVIGGAQTTSKNGVFTTANVFPGTYQVGADCQGKFFMANGQEFSRFVLVDRGNEIVQISETPGNAVTGDQQRVGRSRDVEP